ncbi:MAG: hypothetical protein AB7U81_11110 [Thiohalomonadaceae bacterium]
MRNLRYLLLALALWFGQTALLVHAVDLHAHVTGDTCEVCLHATPAGGALPAAGLVLLPPRDTENPLRTVYRAIAAAPVADALARGPPVFS